MSDRPEVSPELREFLDRVEDAVRAAIGPDVPLQVDANTAYTRDDGAHLARLDEFDLLLIEQPIHEDDFLGHRLLAERMATPGFTLSNSSPTILITGGRVPRVEICCRS